MIGIGDENSIERGIVRQNRIAGIPVDNSNRSQTVPVSANKEEGQRFQFYVDCENRSAISHCPRQLQSKVTRA